MPGSDARSAVLFADGLAAVLDLLIANDAGAERALEALYELPIRRGLRTAVSVDQQLAVFLRDNFTCRYCGRRAIFLPVLRLVSELYPRLFPYHPNWKMIETHVAYWRDTASCDHITPVARGGSSNMDNLATTCYRCNDTKSNWLLAELGWMLQPIANSSWDGLSSRYLELCLRTPAASSEYHRRWRQALIRAASAARISGPESPAP